jgi:hypothetical protein
MPDIRPEMEYPSIPSLLLVIFINNDIKGPKKYLQQLPNVDSVEVLPENRYPYRFYRPTTDIGHAIEPTTWSEKILGNLS